MSHTGTMRDHEAEGLESSEFDFPIICKSCIVDNPYVQLTKADYHKECKICTRPFTVFMWRPAHDAYKKTKVCQTCNKLKNVCQVCLLDLDLEHDQVRDTAPLNVTTHDSIPKSDVNMKFFGEEHDRKRWPGLLGSFGMTEPDDIIDMIRKRQRRLPFHYGMKIKETICSFYSRVGCVRGATCLYPHEMPKPGENCDYFVSDPPYHHAEPQGLILHQAQSQLHHLTLESGEPSNVNRNLQ